MPLARRDDCRILYRRISINHPRMIVTLRPTEGLPEKRRGQRGHNSRIHCLRQGHSLKL